MRKAVLPIGLFLGCVLGVLFNGVLLLTSFLALCGWAIYNVGKKKPREGER